MNEQRATEFPGRIKTKKDHILDCMTEMVLAKFLGRKWGGMTPGEVGIYGIHPSPDSDGPLPLYRPDEGIYVLITGDINQRKRPPRQFFINGWCVADLAWLEENQVRWGETDSGEKHPAWWVEQKQLRGVDELKALDSLRGPGENVTAAQLLDRVGRCDPVVPLDEGASRALPDLEKFVTALRQNRLRWCSALLAGWPQSSKHWTYLRELGIASPDLAPDWARENIKLELLYALKHTGQTAADVDGAGQWLAYGPQNGLIPKSRGAVVGEDFELSEAEVEQVTADSRERIAAAAHQGKRVRWHVGCVDVRAMDSNEARLPIHDGEEGGIFVLATFDPDKGSRYPTLRGWCVADPVWLEREVMKGRVAEGSPMEIAEGEAWWVEQDQLRPMEEVQVLCSLCTAEEAKTISADELLSRVGRCPPLSPLSPAEEDALIALERYVAKLREDQ